MNTKQSGFTVVELLTTIIVATLFVATFYQMFVVLVGVNATARSISQANSLAYSNMRRYPTAASITATGITCASPGTTGNLLNSTGPDLVNYPELGVRSEVVTASFPYGCAAVYDVIKIVSTVTYGTNSRVSHATYVN